MVAAGALPPAKQSLDDPLGIAPGITSQPFDVQAPAGPPGALGQPTGVPIPATPGRGQILPDVLAGRDPSQLTAAELLRDNGGVSATEKLLGLDLQPSIIGAFLAPPGNAEALRHMSPMMRRTAMRNLLLKQRERMRKLELHLREEDEQEEGSERQGGHSFEGKSFGTSSW